MATVQVLEENTLVIEIAGMGPPGQQGPTGATGATGAQGPQGVAGVGVPAGGTTGQALVKVDGTDYNTAWSSVAGGSAVWGAITGTLSSQLDLQSALDGKSSTSHTHTGVYEPANVNIQAHIGSISNPHGVTASQVGAYTTGQVDTLLTGYEAIVAPTTVQTTDNTPTVLQTHAVPTNGREIVEIRVYGYDTTTNDTIWKKMTLGVKNTAGTAVFIGGIDSAVGYDAAASTWSIVVGVSLGNVTITVTGETGKTINWQSTVETF